MSERENLIEQAVGAWRPRGPRGELREHPAWCDLDRAARAQVWRETLVQRALEAALDPRGLSTTARAILARLHASEG